MKTKYLILTGIAGLTVTAYYLIFNRGKKGTREHENIKKQTNGGEAYPGSYEQIKAGALNIAWSAEENGMIL